MGTRSLILRGGIAIAALVALAAEASVAVHSLVSERPLIGASFGLRGTEPLHFEALIDAVGQGRTKLSAADVARIDAVAVSEPLSPVPFVLAGAARGGASGARLVAMAEQRDPRFQPAVTWALGDALKRNDPAAEARAVMRLLALRRSDDRLYHALAALAAAPAARAVIRDELARGPAWRGNFLTAMNGTVDPATAFQFTEAGAAAPTTPTGAPAVSTVDAGNRQGLLLQLVAHQEYDRAYLAWVQWLGDDARPGLGLVFDGGFKHYSALLPFNWDLPSDTGSAVFAPKGGLAIDYAGTDPVLLARQVLVLTPGRYRLVSKAKFEAAASGSDAAVGWTLECRPNAQTLAALPLPLGANGAPVASAPFVVPDTCAAQVLSLAIPAAEFSVRVSGAVQSVAVERIAP